MALKIVFAGTPHFAIPSLEALMTSSHQVNAIYTKPDSPSGRGLKLTYSPIKQFVIDNYPQLPILQPVNLKDSDTQKALSEFYADIMVVIAYGLILPKAVMSLFKYGCINIHASLLPKWRGAAPIQRSLLAGDEKTGVTIMQIDEGLDTGDMLYTRECIIKPDDTSQTLHDNLASLGADALLKTLNLIESNSLEPKPQDNSLSTYAAKILKCEAMINWQTSALSIDRHIRAFNPWPIAFTHLAGQLFKIWEAEIVSTDTTSASAGLIISANERGIEVATQQGILRLLTVQIPGGKPMAARTFLNARANLIIPNQTYLGENIVNHS